MKSIFYSLLVSVAILLVSACNESSEIGNSLSQEAVTIVVDTNFHVTGSTLRNNVVQSRTLSQLIGKLEAEGYGNISSDFVGQLMPSLALDTTNLTLDDIDSVKIFMQMVKGNFVGDSLVPMGLSIYRLREDLPYPIYSDFNVEGYYEDKAMASGVYTASVVNEPDSIQELGLVYTYMHLPVELGRELYSAYLDNPGVFANPSVFARDVFKGLYIRSSYGSGRIADFSSTSLRYYYHRNEWNEDSARYDLVKYVGDYFAVTPEVVVNNNIVYTPAKELTDMIDAGDQLVVAPAGYEVELRFPAPEVIASYNKYSDRMRVLNTVTFEIPVEVIENEFDIAPPPYLLLVLKDKKDEFFSKNQLTDNVTSFYAEYSATNRKYTFNVMRSFILDLMEKETIDEKDYTFILTPVQVNTETSSNSYYGSTQVVSSIVPYVSKPAMAKILLDKAKIRATFSAGNQNNL